jgi:putative aldouronate transport system permease protein
MLVVMLYPFWNTAMTAVSEPKALSRQGDVGLLPKGLSLEGFRELFLYKQLPTYFANTVLYAALGTVLRLLVASLAGYVLSVKHFSAGKAIMAAMVVTMFISGGLIPSYMLIRGLNWMNTIQVMVVPGALDVYTCIVFKTFFGQLPAELTDAASIDGANDLYILFRIVLPISKPLLATFAIFAIVSYWNEWFSALLYLNKPAMHPIQMLLRNLLVTMSAQITGSGAGLALAAGGTEIIYKAKVVRAASIITTTLPIAVVYPFFQKYFTKGIMVGSIKG